MYKHAFQCKRCPKNSTENGCPLWWEIIEENLQTGASRVTKGCGYAMLPKFLMEVVKSGNLASEHASQARNAMIMLPDILMAKREQLGHSNGSGSSV